MVKISSSSEMVPRENSPNLVKLAWNDPYCFYMVVILCSNHSHRKRNDRLEGSLDQVLFAAELEFLKILVPRLPQHTSNVNIECAGKVRMVKTTVFFVFEQLLNHQLLNPS